jgi:hypothetical protein
MSKQPHTPSRISQADAARLMYAAGKWATSKRSEGWIAAGVASNEKFERACRAAKAAEAAFAELVAQLVEDENGTAF